MDPRAEILWLFTGSAVLTLLSSIPMILKLVPRNRWYGLRTHRTMYGTEAEWYAGNRKGGFFLLGFSLVMLAAVAVFAMF